MSYARSDFKNGLRVLTVPMRERSSAAVAIWVKTGSRYEPAKISGISHMLEHMLFKGTKLRSTRQIKQEIEGIGGALNAFTGEEATCYFAKLLRDRYPKALDVLADMINEAVLSAEELAKERTVILEEIKMYKDLPSHYVQEMMGGLLWPNQPLGRQIAGTEETVSNISRQELAQYRDKHYQPANLVVSVSGGIDHNDFLARVEEIFGKKSSGTKSSFQKAEVHQTKPQTLFFEKATEQTHLVIGMHACSRWSPERYKLGVLNVILGANMSSRLFEEVREKRGLAYEIRSGAHLYHDTGALFVSAGVEHSKAPKAINVILNELAKLILKPVSEKELQRAKEYFMSQLEMALEDTMDHLLWVGEYLLERDEFPNPDQIKQEIASVTVKDVQDAARKFFKTSNLNLSMIGPHQEKVQNQIRKDFEIPTAGKS